MEIETEELVHSPDGDTFKRVSPCLNQPRLWSITDQCPNRSHTQTLLEDWRGSGYETSAQHDTHVCNLEILLYASSEPGNCVCNSETSITAVGIACVSCPEQFLLGLTWIIQYVGHKFLVKQVIQLTCLTNWTYNVPIHVELARCAKAQGLRATLRYCVKLLCFSLQLWPRRRKLYTQERTSRLIVHHFTNSENVSKAGRHISKG